MSISGCIRYQMLTCVCLTIGGVASAVELQDIRATVQRNLERIESVHVITHQWGTGFSPPQEEIHTLRHEWAIDRDGRFRSATSPSRELEAEREEFAGPLWYESQKTFDGEEGRGLWWTEDGENDQGVIFNEDMVQEEYGFSKSRSLFGRGIGWLVRHRSLVDWLDKPEVTIEGEKTIDGKRCVVVFASRSGGPPSRIRLYLSIDHGFALKRYQYWFPGREEVHQTANFHQFEEVEPGLWLPFKGVFSTYSRTYESKNRTGFEVQELSINKPLSNELFETEFREGLPVTDYRNRERVE